MRHGLQGGGCSMFRPGLACLSCTHMCLIRLLPPSVCLHVKGPVRLPTRCLKITTRKSPCGECLLGGGGFGGEPTAGAALGLAADRLLLPRCPLGT